MTDISRGAAARRPATIGDDGARRAPDAVGAALRRALEGAPDAADAVRVARMLLPGLRPSEVAQLTAEAGGKPGVLRDVIFQVAAAERRGAPTIRCADGTKSNLKPGELVFFSRTYASELADAGFPDSEKPFVVLGVHGKSDKGDGFVTVQASNGARHTFAADAGLVRWIRR